MEGEIRVNASPLFNYALHEMYPLLQVFVILVKYESVIFAEINYIRIQFKNMMRYLFVIQGEGRGHLTQALTLKEMLTKQGHKVVSMLVGKSASRSLPDFFIQKAGVPVHQFLSPNFLPTPSNKRVNIFRSILYNLCHLESYRESICFVRNEIIHSEVDVVVNFYELLTGLAYCIFSIPTPYFCIGHQYLFLHRDFRFPPINRGNLFLLKLFTRMTSIGCEQRLALSFREMERDKTERIVVVPPLLRDEVLSLSPEQGDYILGYMVNAGYADEVNHFHTHHPNVKMHFFWDKKGVAEEIKVDDCLTYHQVNDDVFLKKMQDCRAYATTGGFESVCEAMYLGKAILMVPVHIEQDCNAFDAVQTGTGIASDTFNLDILQEYCRTFHPNPFFQAWVQKAQYRIVPQLIPQQKEERQHLSYPSKRIFMNFYKKIFTTLSLMG